MYPDFSSACWLERRDDSSRTPLHDPNNVWLLWRWACRGGEERDAGLFQNPKMISSEDSSRVVNRSPTFHRARHCAGAQLHEPHLDTEVVPLATILISH
jgi:hypothetical protein